MIYKENILSVPNSDTAFAMALKDVLEDGDNIEAGNSKSVGANKSSKELLAYSIRIESPRKRLIYNPERKLNLPAAIARFVWMMAGSDRLHDIAFYEEKVKSFSDDGISVPGSDYGHRMLQPRPGLNQLISVIRRLKEDSSTRRAAISIYQPEDAVRESKDIPCTFGLLYHVRNNKLHATTIMRSNNAFILLPYNLFEFSLLAEIVATEIGVPLGSLTHFASSMHIYEADYEKAKLVVKSDKTDFETKFQMPEMPSEVSPVEQVKELVILESELRHASAGVGVNNIEELISKGNEKLNSYWQQFYFLLLFHILKKSNRNQSTSLETLKGVIEEPYLSYLPPNAFAKDKSNSGMVQEPFDFSSNQDPIAKVIPIFSSKRMESLEKRVDEWEGKHGKQIDRKQFVQLQKKFSETVAAREGNLELSTEEVELAINDLLKK